MTNEFKDKFPHMHKKIAEIRYKNNYKQQIVTYKSITYDKSYLPNISDTLIENFTDYQTRYPDKIIKCIKLFENSLTLLENEENIKHYTEKPVNENIIHYRNQKITKNLEKIYNILLYEYHILMGISLTDQTNPNEMQNITYSWIKFITSQNPLNEFIII